MNAPVSHASDPLPPVIAAKQSRGGAVLRIARRLSQSISTSVVVLTILLGGLPVAVWLDLRQLSENVLRQQVDSFAATIDGFRSYYDENVVTRILSHPGNTAVVADYQDVPGAIPIPTTQSLELGGVLAKANAAGRFAYRFISDYPFPSRAPHAFDAFERQAMQILGQKRQTGVYDISGSIFERQVRFATPIVMEGACVSCHNASSDSPKRDWKTGDVGGIEEFTVSLPLAANLFAFKFLLAYFGLVAAVGLAWIALQRHQSSLISRINNQLARANDFLAGIAQKLAKYLSPQHYKSIFSGEKDVTVSTERKKLTIFFSDVVNFTATTERMQPEELTALLNEYLTEMSRVAIKHGGSVNKFIGDAMLIFFGDYETRSVEENARACVRMAFEMQRRLGELNVKWRKNGIEEPFRSRMGINTGYCNVGNFGSDERMDYTIIGAEANLAARLQSIAEPNGIVLSYETFALVSDMVRAQALDPIRLKGISREIVPYAVEGHGSAPDTARVPVITEHIAGLDLFLDVRAMNSASAERVASALAAALDVVKKATSSPAASPSSAKTA